MSRLIRYRGTAAAAAAALLAPSLGAQRARASDAPHALADCNAAASADTLVAAASADSGARAYWLDAATLQWPGAPAGARYALHRSAHAALRATLGAPVSGADLRIPLAPATTPLPPDVAARFRFVGAGARLALPPAARAQLADLLRGEVLLVREDDQGRVVAATRLPLPHRVLVGERVVGPEAA